MNYDCATRTVAGTTLVTVRVRNEAAVPRRVRVRNDLPGPVLPPRRDGVPERGWDDEGFTGVVAPDCERALGYACPVDCADETPVSVDWLGRADDDGDDAAEREAEAIRSLGRARPPADAVSAPGVGDRSDGERSSAVADAAESTSEPEGADDSAGGTEDAADTSHDEFVTDASDATPLPGVERGASEVPRPVESWLSAVEVRVRRAEALTDATAAETARVLETAGDVSDLPAAVEADAASLRAFAARATALAQRAAESDAEPVVAAVEGL